MKMSMAMAGVVALAFAAGHAPLLRSAETARTVQFEADIDVTGIPATMNFALPDSIIETGDPNFPRSYGYSWQIVMTALESDPQAFTQIGVNENCEITGCLSGVLRTLAPEHVMDCWVLRSAAGNAESWPCRFDISADRARVHLSGPMAKFGEIAQFRTTIRYAKGPLADTYNNNRFNSVDLSRTAPGRYEASDAAGNVADHSSCAQVLCSGAAIPAMDAASDIRAVSITLTEVPPSPIALNQHGLTGTWFNRSTTGEGFIVETYPSANILSAGWFTYADHVGGTEAQRWYVLTGSVAADTRQVDLSIGAAYAGNFDAPPANEIQEVGRAVLRLDSCTHGTLDYAFYDGRRGQVDFTRFTSNLSCSDTGGSPAEPASYLLSGNWFDPALNGQGIQFELNPANHLLFAPWYTYAPQGATLSDPATSQRWYTLQLEVTDAAATAFHDIPLYSTTGGVFDAANPVTTVRIGSVDVDFHSCTSATLKYRFTAGENAGRTGTQNLQRVGPAPAQCAL